MKYSKPLTDKQLVDKYLAGDKKALGTLIMRHKDKIYTSIYILTKDRVLSDDIFQDVMIKIIDWIDAGRYTEEGKFASWAMYIARNLIYDYFRKAKRMPVIQPTNEVGNSMDIFEVLDLSLPGVDVALMNKETAIKIRHMIDMLLPEFREVLILRHYAELPFKEIAKLTNCSINTAIGRMRYALINLRKIMEEQKIAL